MESDIRGAHVPCPQCGAPLLVPHGVPAFTCPWCSATLQESDSVPLHYLVERPSLTRQEAEGLARGRLAASVLTPALAARSRVEVGGLRYLPFLRIRREGRDEAEALAALPSPDLFELADVPADLHVMEADPPDGAILADTETVRARLLEAATDRSVQSLVVEYRAYYPVSYAVEGEHYSAVMPGGGGDLLAARRPARRRVAGDRAISLGVAAVLFSEAVFLPGLWPRVLAILATAGSLFPALRWLVSRHG